MSKKWMGLALAAVMMTGALAGCGDKEDGANGTNNSPAASAPAASGTPAADAGAKVEGKVTASGSTALLPLVLLAAQKFMEANPKADIAATGGGSGTGVKNVADGVSNIGNSDVEADKTKYPDLVDHVVAVAPFALIVSKDVTVDSLTKQQAADIYMGKIKNWKEVGGQDAAIQLVHRPDSSGSMKLVKQIILEGKDFSKEGVVQDSSKTVAQAVTQGKGAIGYVDAPYVTDAVKALKIDGAEMSKENIQNGKYVLYGVEHMYTKGEAQGATKAFLDYITSKEFMGGADVEKLGFLPADLIKK